MGSGNDDVEACLGALGSGDGGRCGAGGRRVRGREYDNREEPGSCRSLGHEPDGGHGDDRWRRSHERADGHLDVRADERRHERKQRHSRCVDRDARAHDCGDGDGVALSQRGTSLLGAGRQADVFQPVPTPDDTRAGGTLPGSASDDDRRPAGAGQPDG